MITVYLIEHEAINYLFFQNCSVKEYGCDDDVMKMNLIFLPNLKNENINSIQFVYLLNCQYSTFHAQIEIWIWHASLIVVLFTASNVHCVIILGFYAITNGRLEPEYHKFIRHTMQYIDVWQNIFHMHICGGLYDGQLDKNKSVCSMLKRQQCACVCAVCMLCAASIYKLICTQLCRKHPRTWVLYIVLCVSVVPRINQYRERKKILYILFYKYEYLYRLPRATWTHISCIRI